jgi:hypothetical protein
MHDKEEESSVHGDHHARTHSKKNSSNKKSHRTKTQTEQSSEEESLYQPSGTAGPIIVGLAKRMIRKIKWSKI